MPQVAKAHVSWHHNASPLSCVVVPRPSAHLPRRPLMMCFIGGHTQRAGERQAAGVWRDTDILGKQAACPAIASGPSPHSSGFRARCVHAPVLPLGEGSGLEAQQQQEGPQAILVDLQVSSWGCSLLAIFSPRLSTPGTRGSNRRGGGSLLETSEAAALIR